MVTEKQELVEYKIIYGYLNEQIYENQESLIRVVAK